MNHFWKSLYLVGIFINLLPSCATSGGDASPGEYTRGDSDRNLGTVSVTYLGTACFLITHRDTGFRILVDPGELFWYGPGSGIIQGLGKVDLVLVTHGDPDHINRLRDVVNFKTVPIFGPQSLKEVFGDLNLQDSGRAELNLGPVHVRLYPTPHGLRHSVDHLALELSFPEVRIVHLGDGFSPPPGMEPGMDLLLVTVGGMETNVENALKCVRFLKPRDAVPMHWEILPGGHRLPEEFIREGRELGLLPGHRPS